MKTLSHSILSLVFPQECDLCRGEVDSPDDGVACPACWDKTKIFERTETLCTKCGAFLFGAKDSRCGKCEDHAYDRALAVGIYEHALSASVLRLKRIPSISSRLKRLILDTVDRFADADAIILPVPLSDRRYRERGFNQAELLAGFLAKETKLAIDTHSLIRDVDTPMHRVGMDAKAREKTVKGAFRVTRPKLIGGRDLILVDDVLTSGSTASICAKVLKENGAATVKVMTIARAG